MAVPDSSIDPRILESAKKEFLKYGYTGAQLKNICRDAGVTTGALYKRYKGKEDLFGALVLEAVEDITAMMEAREECAPETLTDEDLMMTWGMEESSVHSCSMQEWFDFLYARKDAFTLLLRCAEGTRYSDFTDRFVERMTDGTDLYLREAIRRNMVDRPISRKELQVLLSAFWVTVCTPFLLGFDREELAAHCSLVNQMFNWQKILGIHMPG